MLERIYIINVVLVYFAFSIMYLCGYMWEAWAKLVTKVTKKNSSYIEITPEGYAPLFVESERFYIKWILQRMNDALNRPITSAPDTYIDILERKGHYMNSSFTFTGNKMKCLNLGSYNYLGFAKNEGPIIEECISAVGKFNISNCTSSIEGGYISVHKELEKTIAEFVGKESAIIFEMGYATNSTTIPALVKKGALVLSDSLNHASLVMGLRASGAYTHIFKHNDTVDLEKQFRRLISQGQPGSGEPYTMILIVVEGVYSMEGVICQLPEIIRIKKKYKAYLYVDEAHSIAALGNSGRGVCDYFGVSPDEVDILMGTFTKSFASVGGYVASNKELIAHLRSCSFGTVYSYSMSAACAQQALSALRVIMGKDGTDIYIGVKKILQLKENSNYFRSRLKHKGFMLLGNNDSPIIPLMMYYPAKFSAFSRQMLKLGIAVVVVMYPATSMLTARARFCISANHTREDLDYALWAINEVGDNCNLKYLL